MLYIDLEWLEHISSDHITEKRYHFEKKLSGRYGVGQVVMDGNVFGKDPFDIGVCGKKCMGLDGQRGAEVHS